MDDTIDLVVADTYTLMLESSVNFAVDDVAEQTILDAISDGTRFILAIWRTTPAEAVTANAGRVGWTTDARGATGSAIPAITANAGRVGWRTDARGTTGSAGTPIGLGISNHDPAEAPDDIPLTSHISTTLWLREFPSHRLIRNLPGWLNINWETRWQRAGRIDILFEELAMTSEEVLEIANGSFAIECVLHTQPIQRLYAAIDSITLLRSISDETFNTKPINRLIIVDNYGDAGQTQASETYIATGILANYRPKYGLHIDPDLDTAQKRQEWATQEFRRTTDIHETSIKTSLSSFQEPAKIQIKASDMFGVLSDYWVTPPGGNRQLENAIAAGSYIEELLDNTGIPNLNAAFSIDNPGLDITEPLRYARLYDAIARATRYGELGISTNFDHELGALDYQVHKGRDRRQGLNFTTFSDRLDIQTLRVGDVANRNIWYSPAESEPMLTQALQCIGIKLSIGVTVPFDLRPHYRILPS